MQKGNIIIGAGSKNRPNPASPGAFIIAAIILIKYMIDNANITKSRKIEMIMRNRFFNILEVISKIK